MSAKYNSLEELRRKKQLLKKDVQEMEELITFSNAKESLSKLTDGFTDRFLKEEVNEDGETKIALKKEEIFREISTGVKDKIMSKNAMLGLADTAIKGGGIQNAIQLGTAALVAGYAKNSMKNSNWKKKIIGIALIYLAPIAIRFIREKLEAYQKQRSISSMEKLI